MRGRSVFTTYRYDDPEHPERVTKTEQSPEFTRDDWALLVALADVEAQEKASTTQCGWPMELAYHADTDGWWERTSYKCYPCSTGADDDVYHDSVRSTLPPDRPLMPFDLEATTETKQT